GALRLGAGPRLVGSAAAAGRGGPRGDPRRPRARAPAALGRAGGEGDRPGAAGSGACGQRGSSRGTTNTGATDQQERRDQAERGKGQHGDRDEAEPVDVLGAARHARGAQGWRPEAGHVLLQHVERGDEDARDREGERVREAALVLPVGRDPQDQDERVHEYALVPAQGARHETPDLAEVEATEGRNERHHPSRVEQRESHSGCASSIAARTLANVALDTNRPFTKTDGVPVTPRRRASCTSSSTSAAVSLPWTHSSSAALSRPGTNCSASSYARWGVFSVLCARKSTGSRIPKPSLP